MDEDVLEAIHSLQEVRRHLNIANDDEWLGYQWLGRIIARLYGDLA